MNGGFPVPGRATPGPVARPEAERPEAASARAIAVPPRNASHVYVPAVGPADTSSHHGVQSLDAGSAADPLQFDLEELATPLPVFGAGPRAFKRAVCIQYPPPIGTGGGGLERKVKQIVALFRRPAGDLETQLAALAAHLRQQPSLRVVSMTPPQPDPLHPLTTRSIRTPFLAVTASQAQAGVAERGEEEAVIVDPALRDHLAVAPPTPAFQRSLAAAVPEGPFVASRASLARLVASLAPALEANFASQGMDLPPWRRTAALMHRWSGVDAQLQLQQWQQQQQHSSPAFYAPNAPTGASSISGRPAAAAVAPIIFGFEVGSVAVGREPWRNAEPGAFSRALAATARAGRARSARSALTGSDDTVEDSEDAVALMGASPVDVFRSGLARQLASRGSNAEQGQDGSGGEEGREEARDEEEEEQFGRCGWK